MAQLAALFAAFLALLLPTLTGCSNPFSAEPTEPRSDDALPANARVVRIVDGDTMVVELRGVDTKVRMIGFDTPESVDPRTPVECFGKEASKHLAELAPPGTRLHLQRDVEEHDRYGRLLAYVYRASDGLFLNLRMVEDGYANTLSIAPNITHQDEFRAAERDARNAGRGLWSAC